MILHDLCGLLSIVRTTFSAFHFFIPLLCSRLSALTISEKLLTSSMHAHMPLHRSQSTPAGKNTCYSGVMAIRLNSMTRGPLKHVENDEHEDGWWGKVNGPEYS